MIRWLLRRSARAFGKKYAYDVSYMIDVIDASANAGMRLSAFPFVTQYRGPKAAGAICAGAMLASTLDGDCGPCAQLVVDMAVRAGADPGALKLCASGAPEKAGDFGLGFRYAQAAIAGDPIADDLRVEIEERFGEKAVVAAAFAAASGRFYPVFKRGLGHGAVCAKLQFGGASVPVGRAA